MKHIDKYNKFIKLNEDTEIIGNIDEYDLSIIKDGLIELEDLGWKITDIDKYKYDSSIVIRLEIDLYSSKISKDIECVYKFNKIKIYNRKQGIANGRKIYPYTLTEYERNIFNIIEECSLFLINILDYNNGYIYIKEEFWNCAVNIYLLSKNKTE